MRAQDPVIDAAMASGLQADAIRTHRPSNPPASSLTSVLKRNHHIMHSVSIVAVLAFGLPCLGFAQPSTQSGNGAARPCLGERGAGCGAAPGPVTPNHSGWNTAVNPTILTYTRTNSANDSSSCLNTRASPNNCFSATTFWAVGTKSLSTGKCYLEMKVNGLLGDTGMPAIGFTLSANSPYNTNSGLGTVSNSLGFFASGSGDYNGGAGPTAPTFASGAVLGIAIDFTDARVWMRDTASPTVWNAGGGATPARPSTGFSISGITRSPLFPAASQGFFARNEAIINTGGSAFQASAPSGYSPCY